MKRKKINLFDDILKSNQLKQLNNKKLEAIRTIARDLDDKLQILNNKEKILSNQIDIKDIEEMNDKYLVFSKMIADIYNENKNQEDNLLNRELRKIEAYYKDLLSKKEEEYKKSIKGKIVSYKKLITSIFIGNGGVAIGIILPIMLQFGLIPLIEFIGIFQLLLFVFLLVLLLVILEIEEKFLNRINFIKNQELQECEKVRDYYSDTNHILNNYVEQLTQLPKNGIVNSALLQDLFGKNIVAADPHLQDQYHSTFLKFIQNNLTDSTVEAKKLIDLFGNIADLLFNYEENCTKLHALEVDIKYVKEFTVDSDKLLEKHELEQENQKIRRDIVSKYSIIQKIIVKVSFENSKVSRVVDKFLSNTLDQRNDKLNAKVLRLVYKHQSNKKAFGKSLNSSSVSKNKLTNQATTSIRI